jgi:hypothetical protein
MLDDFQVLYRLCNAHGDPRIHYIKLLQTSRGTKMANWKTNLQPHTYSRL